MTAFLLCIGDHSGWTRVLVDIDVPESILDIEAKMHANERLTDEQGGQLKTFYRATDSGLRRDHDITANATTIIKPTETTT